jgi:5-methylcytosine-specific restriction endonuclease McrA
MNRALKAALSETESGRAILADRQKASRSRRERVRGKPKAPGRTKAQRKQTKTQADREVYAAVRERDAGLCTVQLAASVLGECGGVLTLDHQWGRGKEPTTLENCRMLCWDHHERKTNSATEEGPNRVLWLNDFREHALSHDYYAEVAKAEGVIALERAQHPHRHAPTVPVMIEVRHG